MGTDFNIIYTRFYSKITDDMYMELDFNQTSSLLEELLVNAVPWFEFPKVSLRYDLTNQRFTYELSDEEINIIATYMVLGWLDQQLASIEVTRMKYSGSDFKMTSQANHMNKLKELRKEYERIGFHLQRLYKRRRYDKHGNVRSTFGSIMQTSVRRGNVQTIIPSTKNESLCDGMEWEGFEGEYVPDPPAGDDTWEDMGDLPPTHTPSSPEDGWDEM